MDRPDTLASRKHRSEISLRTIDSELHLDGVIEQASSATWNLSSATNTTFTTSPVGGRSSGIYSSKRCALERSFLKAVADRPETRTVRGSRSSEGIYAMKTTAMCGLAHWDGAVPGALPSRKIQRIRCASPAASIHSILLTRFHPARNCTRLLPMGDSLAMASGEHLGYSTALRLERYCPTLRIRISVPFCTTHGRQRDSM